jgi:hypothetical protein
MVAGFQILNASDVVWSWARRVRIYVFSVYNVEVQTT